MYLCSITSLQIVSVDYAPERVRLPFVSFYIAPVTKNMVLSKWEVVDDYVSTVFFWSVRTQINVFLPNIINVFS